MDMLLRNVVSHVRDQNWTAIAIDFLIVVVGVFLGIQVSNWNEVRVQAASEREMLQRLQEEFLSVENDLQRAADQYSVTLTSTRQVIEALRSGEAPTDDAAFRDLLRSAQFVWDVPNQSATYSEMVSTATLSQLSDPGLRAALTRYGDYAARYARKLPEALAVVLDPDSRFLQAVDWNSDTDMWSTPEGVVAYDWVSLLSAEPELQSWQAYQLDLRDYTRGQLREVQSVLDLLGRPKP